MVCTLLEFLKEFFVSDPQQKLSESPLPVLPLREDEVPIRLPFFRLMRAIMFEPNPHEEIEMLPLAQLRLLWAVYHAHEAPMKDFSERLQVSQSTVTQVADKLVKRGFIERIADPADRRVVRLKMTSKGHSLLSENDAARDAFLRSVWEALSSSEREAVVTGMETLASRCEKAREAAGHPLIGWGEPPRPVEAGEEAAEANSPSQPVVDLMSRRVRGRN